MEPVPYARVVEQLQLKGRTVRRVPVKPEAPQNAGEGTLRERRRRWTLPRLFSVAAAGAIAVGG